MTVANLSIKLDIPEPTMIEMESKQKIKNKSLPERISAFGIICALIGVTMFSLGSLIAKLLTDLHSIEILVFRCIFQFIPFFIITVWKKYPVFGEPGHRWDLFIRCITGTTSLITLYTSYRLMPLSDSTTIYQASPIFVTVFAYLILRDRPNVVQLITGVITVIGVFIISKPEFIFGSDGPDKYDKRSIGLVLSLTAAITSALSLINLRKLKSTPVPVVVMWYSVAVVVIGGSVLPILDRWILPSGIRQWGLLAAIGAAGVLNQYFQTTAFKYESPGPISVTRSFNIVLAFIWEMTIFHEPVQWQSITGAVLISSCVVMTAVYKIYQECPKRFEKFLKPVFRMCRKGNGHKDSDGNPSDCNNNSKLQLGTSDGQLSDTINTISISLSI